jgi:hypothetical protein
MDVFSRSARGQDCPAMRPAGISHPRRGQPLRTRGRPPARRTGRRRVRDDPIQPDRCDEEAQSGSAARNRPMGPFPPELQIRESCLVPMVATLVWTGRSPRSRHCRGFIKRRDGIGRSVLTFQWVRPVWPRTSQLASRRASSRVSPPTSPRGTTRERAGAPASVAPAERPRPRETAGHRLPRDNRVDR